MTATCIYLANHVSATALTKFSRLFTHTLCTKTFSKIDLLHIHVQKTVLRGGRMSSLSRVKLHLCVLHMCHQLGCAALFLVAAAFDGQMTKSYPKQSIPESIIWTFEELTR